MGKISVLIVFGLQLFWTLFSSAQITDISGITHGAEFEFTNSWIYESDSPEKLGGLRGRELISAQKMAVVVRAKCKTMNCKVRSVLGKWGVEYRVTMNDGWWFQISYDPLCVEIQTKPSTIQQLYSQRVAMEELIFASAKEAGLEVRSNRATHLNMGARSAFKYDVRKLFNYFVDSANNPEFASGVFRQNWNTAPPLTALPINPAEVITSIENRIRLGQIQEFSELASAIENELYVFHPNPQFLSSRNQELNLTKLKQLRKKQLFSFLDSADVPIERRAVRAVDSFQNYILHVELQEARVQWIASQPDFIPFVYRKAQRLEQDQAKKFFADWVQEMGLDSNRYIGLLFESKQLHIHLKRQCTAFYNN